MSSSTMRLEEAIRQTQKTLKPIISKPKCTSQLLAKPPFRFIHDIVTATMASTGFPKNYFTSQELASKNLKDKTSKMAFLKKLIRLVSVCTGSEVDVRPSKIVAGSEPINTNILLTLFGTIAVDKTIDHAAAIKHCQFGGGIEEFNSKEKASRQSDNITNAHEATEKIQTRNLLNPLNKPSSLASKTEDESINEEGKQNLDMGDSLRTKIKLCNSDPHATRVVIERITSKPKCSEKLLARPPFRFLHDLIMAIDKNSHLQLEHVLNHDELDSSNVKTKETKLQFLEKVVGYLQMKLQISIDLKPSKVVAGLEAEKTCHFLQLLATLALYEEKTAPLTANTTSDETNDIKIEKNAAMIDVNDKHVIEPGNGSGEQELKDLELQDNKKSERSLAEAIPIEEDESKTNEQDIYPSDTCTVKEYKKPTFNDEEKVSITPSETKQDDGKNDEHNSLLKLSSNSIIDHESKVLDKQIMQYEIKAEESDIHHLFFGTNDQVEETISDDTKHHVRPKTARRRPPRVKERIPSAESMKIPGEIKKPVIFKDDDNGLFLNSREKSQHFEGSDCDAIYDSTAQSNNRKTMRLNLDINKKRGGTTSLPSSFVKPTPYNLDAISESIQNIARAAAPIGGVMDYLPSEVQRMLNERDFWRDECERQDLEFFKERKKTSDELESIQSDINFIESEIERITNIVIKKRAKVVENDEWIHNQISRICRVKQNGSKLRAS